MGLFPCWPMRKKPNPPPRPKPDIMFEVLTPGKFQIMPKKIDREKLIDFYYSIFNQEMPFEKFEKMFYELIQGQNAKDIFQGGQ